MAVRSPKLRLGTAKKMHLINPDNLEYVKRYKVDMSIRNLAETTIHSYEINLYQWFTYILDYQDNKSVLELTDDEITEFLYFCKQFGNNTCRMKVRISVIAAFYKFLRKKKLMQTNPVEFIEPPKKSTPVVIQTFLTTEQIALMRESLIKCGNTQLRLYATLSLSTMARASAIASLKWLQIDINNCVIHDVLEKEGKVVDLFFNDEVKQLLIETQEMRKDKIDDHGWVFYSLRTTPTKHIHVKTLNKWCTQIGEMIGVPSLHPHDFRHSGATMLRNAGMSLEDVSVLLNHESTDVTKRFYIKQDTARINDLKSRYNL